MYSIAFKDVKQVWLADDALAASKLVSLQVFHHSNKRREKIWLPRQ